MFWLVISVMFQHPELRVVHDQFGRGFGSGREFEDDVDAVDAVGLDRLVDREHRRHDQRQVAGRHRLAQAGVDLALSRHAAAARPELVQRAGATSRRRR